MRDLKKLFAGFHFVKRLSKILEIFASGKKRVPPGYAILKTLAINF